MDSARNISNNLNTIAKETQKMTKLKALELERQGVPKDTIDAALDL